MKFLPAPEVYSIAETLIPKYHRHLVGVRVDYLFSEETPKKGGKEVWGTMRKVSGLTAYEGADKRDQERGVTDPFFVMTISQPIWDKLSSQHRIALVDHELCHGAVEIDDDTGESKIGTIGHDLEEFRCIVERHGFWRPDIEKMDEAFDNAKNKKVKVTKSDDDETETQEEDE